jgi:PTS hybrid protein
VAAPVVALVLVSHSDLLSRGVAQVAAQMAPDVLILPAGGTGDGRIGTGFELIEAAIEQALDGGRSAVVLTDLGSAALSAESVLEMAEPEVAARVRIVDAPLVEGAVEAAVVAQTGADLRTVVEAAEDAGTTFARSSDGSVGGVPGVPGGGRSGDAAGQAAPADEPVSAPAAVATGGVATDSSTPEAGPGAAGAPTTSTVGGTGSSAQVAEATPASHAGRAAGVPAARGTAVLRNRLGLHARPAAQLVRTVSAFDALVTVNGVDARSVLALVGLGATGGQELVVAATGPQARHAVNAVVDELENGFGEA